ncbi:hypothetical protein J132_11151 [Termitomyces sp. J132]|nr:hypothetical protein J132_11151 [Termitomyces sp. J132]
MNTIDVIFGAFLSGVILDAWLYGLICILSYQYYVNFPSDGRGTKLLVAWMVALQLFNVVVESKTVYYYLITSFGITENLAIATWELLLYLGLSSISAFSVQAYYAYRTYLLTKSRFLFAVIFGLALLQLGFGLATMAETFKVVIIAKLTTLTWVSVPWFAFAAACDLVIAAVQVVFLHRHRSGLPRTNRLIKILSLYILSTGLLTSVVAIVELTSFAAIGFNFPLVFLSVAMGALYVVSFLAK